jgi:uncharacterized protein (TIGR00266 family)
MNIELLLKPASAVARVHLDAGDTLTAQWGAMVMVQGGVQLETTSKKKGGGGGLMKGLKRMLAGESIFLNHFTGTGAGGDVVVAPSLPGDVIEQPLRGGALLVQGSSWLASSGQVDVDASYQGFAKSLFSGESMFWVRLTGTGTTLLSSFGAIYTVDVDGEHVVDTGNVVAFEDTLQYDVGLATKGVLSSFASGEGFVLRFKGRGRVWCQTHQPSALGREVAPMLKPRQG